MNEDKTLLRCPRCWESMLVPHRRWVGLTDEEILVAVRDHYNPHQRAEISFARAIEEAHGIKE